MQLLSDSFIAGKLGASTLYLFLIIFMSVFLKIFPLLTLILGFVLVPLIVIGEGLFSIYFQEFFMYMEELGFHASVLWNCQPGRVSVCHRQVYITYTFAS